MKQYNAILDSLKSLNITMGNKQYDKQAFESWYVEIESNSVYRIVHDGRDAIIVLEVMKNNDWNCLLSDKTKSGKHVIEKLVGELNKGCFIIKPSMKP